MRPDDEAAFARLPAEERWLLAKETPLQPSKEAGKRDGKRYKHYGR